jgi:transketolase
LEINLEKLTQLSKNYRAQLFEKFVSVGQGHPGSTFSMLDIVVTLYHDGFIRFDSQKKEFLDKLVISKGHATVAVYPILAKFGVIDQEEWDKWGIEESYLRVFGNTSIPGINATTGSLGHGIGIGAGMALAYKRMGLNNKVYVVISEGELYEGSTWEGLLFAAHHKLDNLCIFIDINSLIILGSTDDCLKLNSIKDKLTGWDFNMMEVDGHDTKDISSKLREMELNNYKDMPSLIFAKTVKGKGFSIMENKAHWHYWNTLTQEQIDECRKELI